MTKEKKCESCIYSLNSFPYCLHKPPCNGLCIAGDFYVSADIKWAEETMPVLRHLNCRDRDCYTCLQDHEKRREQMMMTKKELQEFDTPCQYIAGKKIVCEVVKSHLALHAEIERLQDRIRQLEYEVKFPHFAEY